MNRREFLRLTAVAAPAVPGSSGPPLHFFMYPQAETDEGRLDSLDPANFHYEMTSRELVS